MIHWGLKQNGPRDCKKEHISRSVSTPSFPNGLEVKRYISDRCYSSRPMSVRASKEQLARHDGPYNSISFFKVSVERDFGCAIMLHKDLREEKGVNSERSLFKS